MSVCRRHGAHRTTSIVLLLLVLLAPVRFAAAQGTSLTTSNADWMHWISDDTSLAALSLPGSHASMADEVSKDAVLNNQASIVGAGIFFVTQTMDLGSQYELGIRVVDIGIHHNNDRFTVHNGDLYLNANFDDVLGASVRFLANHPSETIVMRVNHPSELILKPLWDGTSPLKTTRSRGETFEWYRDQQAYKNFIWPSKELLEEWAKSGKAVPVPALRDVRGKIVILDDFAGGKYGINWNSLIKQDESGVGNPDDKWTLVRNHMEVTGAGDQGKMYVNFMSASVPAGMLTQGNTGRSGTELLKLDTEPLETFLRRPPVGAPRWVSVFVNPAALKHLTEGRAQRVGALMMDFPYEELIDAVIALNKQGAIPTPPKEAALGSMTTIDFGVDRRGQDYMAFSLREARPELCRNACVKDAPRCTFFNYIKPGVFSRQARCFLKQGTPTAPVFNENAASGVAPKSASAGISSGWVEPNVDRYGGEDYKQFDMEEPVPELCRETCRQEFPKCKAFVYNRPGVQADAKGKARCYLKGNVPAPVPNPGCDSGVILSAQANTPAAAPVTSIDFGVDRFGQDYHNYEPDEATPRACLEGCYGDPANCKAFTFVHPSPAAPKGRCYLKSGTPAPAFNSNTDSGTVLAKPSAGIYSGLIEANVDRRGKDIPNQQFDLDEARPEACRDACLKNAACKAFAYAKPGVHGAKARCFLKDGIAAPTVDACCEAGIVR